MNTRSKHGSMGRYTSRELKRLIARRGLGMTMLYNFHMVSKGDDAGVDPDTGVDPMHA